MGGGAVRGAVDEHWKQIVKDEDKLCNRFWIKARMKHNQINAAKYAVREGSQVFVK